MSNDDIRPKGAPVSDGSTSATDLVDQMANLAAVTSTVPVHEALRAMRGRGVPTTPTHFAIGNVIRVDGMKYRVMDETWFTETGSVAVDAYSEDAQRQTLFLSAKVPVKVIGNLP
jgi:hypothetical protein